MFEAGEDPLFIARRFVRIAGEDIGLADPTALNLAVSTMQGDFQSCALFWNFFFHPDFNDLRQANCSKMFIT